MNECRDVDCFERLNKINEGAYGVVFRARDKQTGRICALKKVWWWYCMVVVMGYSLLHGVHVGTVHMYPHVFSSACPLYSPLFLHAPCTHYSCICLSPLLHFQFLPSYCPVSPPCTHLSPPTLLHTHPPPTPFPPTFLHTHPKKILTQIKMDQAAKREGFPLTSVREINVMLSLKHPNIVNVNEVVMARHDLDSIFMVMEYMEHDLKVLVVWRTVVQTYTYTHIHHLDCWFIATAYTHIQSSNCTFIASAHTPHTHTPDSLSHTHTPATPHIHTAFG